MADLLFMVAQNGGLRLVMQLLPARHKPDGHKATQGPELTYLQQAFHFLAESSAKHSTKA